MSTLPPVTDTKDEPEGVKCALDSSVKPEFAPERMIEPASISTSVSKETSPLPSIIKSESRARLPFDEVLKIPPLDTTTFEPDSRSKLPPAYMNVPPLNT